MALIQFSCVATGPFILFRETAERIFKEIGEPFFEEGAFSEEDLPGVLQRLDAAAETDRRKEAEYEAERERRMREGTWEEELNMKEREREEEEKRRYREDSIRLYQRIVPLQEMIRRAIKHEKPVMWRKL
ncbi:DUF1840 domain-containing protein [Sutterella sp.]|uniref:DUF1840 domain-containing protein n=1 Tax=Sutterella sp. TaxID=1981025 RepID=UPI0026E0A46C|nr:DUF1840 domain-containing protein [Sutterella sp.]MDO5530399.1 DUF1840 domain-containing protein [Sutterella sp.]